MLYHTSVAVQTASCETPANAEVPDPDADARH
jgi:hypothetical protein